MFVGARFLVLVSFFLVGIMPAHAICRDITLCVRPPDPQKCVTYKNYCRVVEPPVPAGQPSYSFQLNGLSKDEFANLSKLLDLDDSIQPPQ
jgi:hypothetical protein